MAVFHLHDRLAGAIQRQGYSIFLFNSISLSGRPLQILPGASFTRPRGLSPRRSFHYLCVGMRKLPCQSAGKFSLRRGTRCTFSSIRTTTTGEEKKEKVQNGLARLLINSRRCCRTSVIPSAGAVSPLAMATVKVPPRTVNVTVRRLCQNQHLVDCVH